MRDNRTYQVHANVNVDGRDAALRVTLTVYDETGHAVNHQTWRKHVVPLPMDGMEWQAYSAVTDLVKMMAAVCGDHADLAGIDTPLF